MNKLKIFFLLWLPITGYAQFAIRGDILPKVNDTLYSHLDLIPDLNVGTEGENKLWDFSSLNSGFARKEIIRKQDPDLLKSRLSFDFLKKSTDQTIHLYKVKNGNLYEVGIQRSHPLNSDFTALFVYSKAKLVRPGSLSYGEEYSDNALIYYVLPGKNIPEYIKRKLPITADSLRVKEEVIQNATVDAWGALRLAYQTFNVVRVYQNVLTSLTVELHSMGKWIPINSKVLDPYGNLLTKKTTIFYEFIAENTPESIARIEVDYTGSAKSAEFKASPVQQNIIHIKEGVQEFGISPNPSFGDVKLEMINADFGNYTFEIYNIIGKKLWSREIKVDKSFFSQRLDFTFLGKGTYVWALTNDNGVRVTTKRMVILTP